MLTRLRTYVPVHVTAVLRLGSMLAAGTAHAQALVKVTPIGSRSGELCAQDRALLFEDPTVFESSMNRATPLTRWSRGLARCTRSCCRMRMSITSAAAGRFAAAAPAPLPP
jgi:hypothetical protein